MRRIKLYANITVSTLLLVIYSCSGGSDDGMPQKDTTPPSVPKSLIVSNITENSLELAWQPSTDNVGVQTYLIFQDGNNLTSNTTTSRVIDGLQENTSYSFKVQAKDAAGNVSGFSNEISIATESVIAELQITSGNIETYLGNFIDNVPGDSGNDYKVPSTKELNIWEDVINGLLSNDIDRAVEKSSEVNYQITEFTDTSLSPNQVFYVLEEKSSKQNYWGTYVFSKTPEKEKLVLMAPHIKNDLNTGKQAVFCFKNNLAKAVFISGAHRCNNSSSSSCSGTTSTCNNGAQPYRVSDLAHTTQAAFHKTTEVIFNELSNSVFVQLHGFGKQSSDPYVILSNGTRETPETDYAVMLKDALLEEDATLTFKIAHIDTDWTRLIGFTNTQGRLINNSSDPCADSATTTTGRFIHLEQERTKLRDDENGWIKVSNALQKVF